MIMFETVYELPLTKGYVADWRMQHAVRELIQNALDSESPFEWTLDGAQLRITSRHTVLGVETLLLGSTSKAENADAIGNFGEGYKIALLVLAREGYDVTVLNGRVSWHAEFRNSKRFATELLCIVETSAPSKHTGLDFIIQLKDEDDEDRIRSCCLQMQDNIGEVVEVAKGRILLDRKGELYVGGLFICKTGLDFSYDIKPHLIKLERDRQTVSSWELQLVTKDMWFDSGRIDQIVELIEKGSPDLYHAELGTPKVVADACYRHFIKQHPGAVIARDQQELDDLVDAGMTKVVFASGNTHYAIVKNSASYRARPVVKTATPREILAKWIEWRCPDVQDHAKHEILTKADRWRTK